MEMQKEKTLRQALTNLKVAGMMVYDSARGTQPLTASKFLNVLGKEIQQLAEELSIFLEQREEDIENIRWEIEKQPSLQILRVLVKER